MSGMITPSYLYMSDLSLALFEDSGWYIANYKYSMPLTYGKNMGCGFLSGVDISNTDYYCTKILGYGCTFDKESFGSCVPSKWPDGLMNYGVIN